MLLNVVDYIEEYLGLAWYLPRCDAAPEHLKFGKNIRTRKPFQNHLREIVTSAREKGAQVVLMTFACYIPANYSLQAYWAEKLDYAEAVGMRCPVELWGEPDNVLAAVGQHNAAVRELAGQHPEVVLIDQENLMPHSGHFFRDCCHLTNEGCTLFTNNILSGLCGKKGGN